MTDLVHSGCASIPGGAEAAGATMLEKAAAAVSDCEREKGDAFDISEAMALKIARAVLMAVRDPDDAFMGALYPDPESIVADRGRAAGMRSRRAGRMQIAHFIDAILADGEGR